MKKKYKILDNINFPSDIKNLSQSNLKILASEVREEIIEAVSETASIISCLTSSAKFLSSNCFNFFISDGKLIFFKYFCFMFTFFFLKYN